MTHTCLIKNTSNVLKYLRIISSDLGTENRYPFKIVILAVKMFHKFHETDNKTKNVQN